MPDLNINEALTNLAAVEALVNDVIEANAGRIGTHYDGCWRWHAGCLAVAVSDVLKREGL